jgi:hypothetical protein
MQTNCHTSLEAWQTCARCAVGAGAVDTVLCPRRTNEKGNLVLLFMQSLIQSNARGGRRIVEDMCYEIRRAEGCVDQSDHHTLVNAGERDSV